MLSANSSLDLEPVHPVVMEYNVLNPKRHKDFNYFTPSTETTAPQQDLEERSPC